VEKDNELMPWEELKRRIMTTSFKDMPPPVYEVEEYWDRWRVRKIYWNGFIENVSEHYNKEEAEAVRKLAEFSQ
jgi:hypothetical protein